MDWTNDLTLEFINLYESFPVLWNAVHEDHKNRNSLNHAWQDIAHLMSVDVSINELRKKKESLMTTYRTLAKKVRNSSTTESGAMDVYKPTWFAFNAIDRFKSTSRKTPLSSEESENLQDVCELTVAEKAFQNEENVVYEPLAQERNQNREFIIPGAPKKKGRDPSQFESNVAKHLKTATDVLTCIATKSPTPHTETLQDVSALYGRLLAARLRRLPIRTQIILRNKIENLVFQAELDDIDSARMSNSRISPRSQSHLPISPH